MSLPLTEGSKEMEELTNAPKLHPRNRKQRASLEHLQFPRKKYCSRCLHPVIDKVLHIFATFLPEGFQGLPSSSTLLALSHQPQKNVLDEKPEAWECQGGITTETLLVETIGQKKEEESKRLVSPVALEL